MWALFYFLQRVEHKFYVWFCAPKPFTLPCTKGLSVKIHYIAACLLFTFGGCLSAVASTDTLKVGLSVEPTTLDPHYQNLIPNNQIAGHIFEALIGATPNGSFRPKLAQSWRMVDENTWEFTLRKNVKFHNGSPFNANSVLLSFCRIPTLVGTPSPFTIYTKAIKEITAPDPHTVIIKTKKPYPLLPNELTTIQIISDSLIGSAKVTFVESGCKINAAMPRKEDFDTGKAAIGTGPFKYAEFVKGDHILLKRNDDYWGTKPQWASVRFLPMKDRGARVDALLSGKLDFIENPPIEDMLRILSNPKFSIEWKMSSRVIYIAMDQRSDTTVPPGVKGTNGKNPFRDVRVRKALSMAIDRYNLTLRVMSSFARPAEQLLARNFFGANLRLPPLAYAPDKAKQLLAEAGYPNGFELTLATPNDRYMNDAQVARAIARMWIKIGVKTNVEAMTAGKFFARRNKHEFGVWLGGWGAQTNEISSPLRALVATPNKDKGWGAANLAQFSDNAIDALIDQALVTIDYSKRRHLLSEASKLTMEKLPVLPIHYEVTPWAMKKNLRYKARVDQFTNAFEIVSVKP